MYGSHLFLLCSDKGETVFPLSLKGFVALWSSLVALWPQLFDVLKKSYGFVDYPAFSCWGGSFSCSFLHPKEKQSYKFVVFKKMFGTESLGLIKSYREAQYVKWVKAYSTAGAFPNPCPLLKVLKFL